MTRREFNEELANLGAGVFLKEMLASDQMRAFGVGPDVMPSHTHNVGGEYVVFPPPNDGRRDVKFTEPSFKPLEAFSRYRDTEVTGRRLPESCPTNWSSSIIDAVLVRTAYNRRTLRLIPLRPRSDG